MGGDGRRSRERRLKAKTVALKPRSSGFTTRRRARRGLTVFGTIWSGATVACGLTSSLGGLIAARAVLGLGEAAPFPAMTRVIADWTPPTRRSFVQGLTHSFVSIGTTVTPPLVA